MNTPEERAKVEQSYVEGLNAGVGPMVWETVQRVLEEEEHLATDIALSPNQVPDTRTFNNGRASFARDVLTILRDYRARRGVE